MGFERPRSATVIASKPIVVSYPGAIWWTTPRSVVAPARPHRAPEMDIVSTTSWRVFIPAYLAASELAPAARISKPRVVRYRRNQISGMARRASRIPAWPSRPNMIGREAPRVPTSRVIGCGEFARRSGPLIAQ